MTASIPVIRAAIKDRVSDPESRHEQLMELLSSWHHIPTRDDDEKMGDRLLWCLEHCQGKFRDIKEFDRRVWYFENEQDAALFALKWA
jgi:hypothetical protein